MINWIRRRLGLHVHDWYPWASIHAIDFSCILGRVRVCKHCPAVDREFYPDGH